MIKRGSIKKDKSDIVVSEKLLVCKKCGNIEVKSCSCIISDRRCPKCNGIMMVITSQKND